MAIQEPRLKVTVGDVFTERVSYEATLIVFYTVIQISPSGKTIRVQECERTTLEDHPGGAIVAAKPEQPKTWPRTDKYRKQVFELAPIEVKRITTINGTPSFKTFAGRAYLENQPRLDTMKNH